MNLPRRSFYHKEKKEAPDKDLESRIGDICLDITAITVMSRGGKDRWRERMTTCPASSNRRGMKKPFAGTGRA